MPFKITWENVPGYCVEYEMKDDSERKTKTDEGHVPVFSPEALPSLQIGPQLQLVMPQAGRGGGNRGDSEKPKTQLSSTAGHLVTKFIQAILKRA